MGFWGFGVLGFWGPPIRRIGPRRPAGRAAHRGPAPGSIFAAAEARPANLAHFEALKPAEKRLVVELGETAQVLARRYPHEAETMVRRLGPEGLTAVRVFGDDVAEVLVKEGPESLSVLRKTGRGGWSFFTTQVLPHKKKLAAAGVLAAFMANPEKFVDYAGQATEFAVQEFARAGIQLAVGRRRRGGGGSRRSIGQTLAAYGLDFPVFRYLGMGLAGWRWCSRFWSSSDCRSAGCSGRSGGDYDGRRGAGNWSRSRR